MFRDCKAAEWNLDFKILVGRSGITEYKPQ